MIEYKFHALKETKKAPQTCEAFQNHFNVFTDNRI